MNYHQPCVFIHVLNADYQHIPAKVRQKMSMLNHLLIKLNDMSGMHYILYVDIDYLMLTNITKNKILFTEPVNPSFGVVQMRIEQLIEMHRLEHEPFRTIYEANHYYSLKKQYYE